MVSLLDALNAEAAKLPRQPAVKPKSALDMTDAEYATFKAQVLEDARLAQQQADAARQLAAITRKFGKD